MSTLVRQSWWQRLALLTMCVTVFMLVISPIRPLLPIKTISDQLSGLFPNSRLIARADSFYAASELTLRYRWAFRASLPPEEPVVGYATSSWGLELGLWRPFQTRVERVLPDDTRPSLEALGIHYLVVDPPFLGLTDCSIEQLMKKYDAVLVEKVVFPRGRKRPPDYFYVLRLN
jgi:hypothetical protein